MNDLRDQLVEIALCWERTFGNAPHITAALSELDAARLVGCSIEEYAKCMQGTTAVRRGHDFEFNGQRYQVKANRPSGKPGSFVTLVPKAKNFDWDVLIWILYDKEYRIKEAWSWEIVPYRQAFEFVKRLAPVHYQGGTRLRQTLEAYRLLCTGTVDAALRPFFRRDYLLTVAEKRFYNVLRKAVLPHSVHPKVRLADLVDADERHRLWQANFRRICSKHIDFVICDAALSPLIAVELDGSSHRRPDRVARDRDVDRIFEIASFPLLRVPVQRSYDPKAIEKDILTKLHPAV